MDSISLFLSYNSVDRSSVVAVQKLLEARGISTFLDRDQLTPGLPWPVALEEALRSVVGVAVFIGRDLGGWQKREMWFALDRQVREEKGGRPFPVIPVLLPGSDLTPCFLFLNTWIDLRSGLDGAVMAESLTAFESAIKATGPTVTPERVSSVRPYRGLEAFREEDAAFFAGRKSFAKQLLNLTLGKEDLVAVVGPSGSGKSSVVQAGLIPLLRRQLPPSPTWDAVTFMPGAAPFHRLASALIPLLEPDLSETDQLREGQKLGSGLAAGEVKLESVIDRVIEKSNGTGRLLLIADQFEEVFTLTPEPDRRSFATALLCALGKARFTLLITLRADFYSQIITLDRGLSDRLVPAQVNVGALTQEELRESIVAPAKLVGLEFEPGLVDRILRDVGNEPGNLPLLEFALTGLWSTRQGRMLTNAAYDEIGGVTGALAQRAEAEFTKFSAEEQGAVRRLFSRLVRVARPEEGAEDTKQRIELEGNDILAERVIQVLAGPEVRLLVTGGVAGEGEVDCRTVEVAHEALIRNWKRLRDWLNEDREFLLWRQRLRLQAEQWVRENQDHGYLLRDAPLTEAEYRVIGRHDDVDPSENLFLRESLLAREQKRLQLRRNRRLLSIASSLALLALIGIATLAAFGWWRASNQSQIALSRALAAQSELVFRESPQLFERAILLALESAKRSPSFLNNAALQREIPLLGNPIWHVRLDNPISAIAFSSDARYVITTSGDNLARIFDIRENKHLCELHHQQKVLVAVFSPDGRYVATGSSDGMARVFEVSTSVMMVQVFQGSPVHGVQFSPDGELLAVATDTSIELLKTTRGNQSWNVQLLRRITPPLQSEPENKSVNLRAAELISKALRHQVAKTLLTFSSDGRYLAIVLTPSTLSSDVWILDAKTGSTVSQISNLDSQEHIISFSPFGKYIAIEDFRKVALYESASGKKLVDIPFDGDFEAVFFGANELRVASTSDDNTARIFAYPFGGNKSELLRVEHLGRIRTMAFNSDGTYLATGSDDHVARVTQIKQSNNLAQFEYRGQKSEMGFSSDGRFIVTWPRDPTNAGVKVFETLTGRELWHDVSKYGPVAVNEAGTVALPSDKTMSSIEIVTVASRSSREVFPREAGATAFYSLAFSPEGRYLALADDGPDMKVFDTVTRRIVLHPHREKEFIHTLSLSSDGTYVAAGDLDGDVHIIAVGTGSEVARFKCPASVVALNFSSDKKYIVIGCDDGTVRVVEVANGMEMSRLEKDHSVKAVSFDHGGEHVLSLEEWSDGIVVVQQNRWRTEDLVVDGCSGVSRNLTIEEWKLYLPRERYRGTCPNVGSQ